MSPSEFARAVELELREWGVPADPAELRRLVDDAWPVVQAVPDPARWARAYLAAGLPGQVKGASGQGPAGPDGGRPPWEWPGALRRDCEPHRAHWFALLGWVNVLAVAFSLLAAQLGTAVLFQPGAPFRRVMSPAVPLALGAVCLPLGAVTWALAARDLARMRAGTMDPAGAAKTDWAREIGAGAALIGSCLALFAVCVLAFW